VNPWHDGYVPDKPTSEQIRREAEKLRDTAIELIEHAKTLIEKSVELEKKVSNRNRDSSKRSTKP
jgi:predicted HTH domain antitoxin